MGNHNHVPLSYQQVRTELIRKADKKSRVKRKGNYKNIHEEKEDKPLSVGRGRKAPDKFSHFAIFTRVRNISLVSVKKPASFKYCLYSAIFCGRISST